MVRALPAGLKTLFEYFFLKCDQRIGERLNFLLQANNLIQSFCFVLQFESSIFGSQRERKISGYQLNASTGYNKVL